MMDRIRYRRMRTAACAWLVWLAAHAGAAEWYVNNVDGNDAHAGTAPATAFHSISRAIAAAAAGDTIHLAATDRLYRQAANFYGHPGGEEGKPIVLDGHDATLSGADPCPPEGWTPYRGDTLQRNDMTSRGFMLIDGKMVFYTPRFNVLRPGELCYAPDFFKRLYMYPPTDTPLEECTVEVGQPDGGSVVLDAKQWQRSHSRIGAVRRYNGLEAPTWVKLNGQTVDLVHARDRLEPGQWTSEDGTLYFRPPDGKSPDALHIECIVRGNGVQMNGSQSHFVIRNLNVQHVYNDGFNIHGAVTHAEFYNCNARQCGDEGFSAHDQCETVLDGAVYDQCDNGIANVNNAGFSITRNVICANSRHVGILIQERPGARHTIENAILVDNPSQLSGGNMTVDNVLILRTDDGPRTGAMGCGPDTTLRRITAVNNTSLLRVNANSSVRLEHAILGGGQGGIHARTDEPAEVLTLKHVRFGSDLTMEWGARYPWERQPLADWTAGSTDTAPAEIAFPDRLPEGFGCTPDLIERVEQWMANQKQ